MRDNVRQRLKENSEKNYDKVRLEMLSMMSKEERAKAFADRHQEAELQLRGLGATYGYQRIYNAEIGAYERGATEQDPISYLRGRNEALIEMADVIEKKEQATIDKACEAHCILCDHYLTCHDLQDFDCCEIQEFKDKIKELL